MVQPHPPHSKERATMLRDSVGGASPGVYALRTPLLVLHATGSGLPPAAAASAGRAVGYSQAAAGAPRPRCWRSRLWRGRHVLRPVGRGHAVFPVRSRPPPSSCMLATRRIPSRGGRETCCSPSCTVRLRHRPPPSRSQWASGPGGPAMCSVMMGEDPRCVSGAAARPARPPSGGTLASRQVPSISLRLAPHRATSPSIAQHRSASLRIAPYHMYSVAQAPLGLAVGLRCVSGRCAATFVALDSDRRVAEPREKRVVMFASPS